MLIKQSLNKKGRLFLSLDNSFSKKLWNDDKELSVLIYI